MASACVRRNGTRLARLLPTLGEPAFGTSIALPSPSEPTTLTGARAVSTQAVRTRIKSVQSIQKITQAMKMVAASKLKGAQVRAEKSRGFWQPFTILLGDYPGIDVSKTIIVSITTDKGLCGGVNSSICRISRAFYKLSTGPEKEAKHIIIGEKGKAQLQRDSKKFIGMTITEGQKTPMSFTQVSMIADDILKNFEYDGIRLLFNKFHSTMSFLPTVSTILSPEIIARESEQGGKLGDLDSYEIEGGDTKAEVLRNLCEFHFAASFFNAVCENASSEQGARMSAMDNSSRNASEMLEKLKLFYNRTRQAAITTELIEIISGAAALDASG